jgi:hypothetical protein
MLRGGDALDVKNFDAFFNKFVFARMTDENNLSNLAKNRDELFELFDKCRSAKSREVRSHLNEITTNMMLALFYGPGLVTANVGGKQVQVTVIKIGGSFFTLDLRPVNIPQGAKFSRAAKDFHPAVKYNAVLIMGMLDTEAARPDKPPKPYSAVRSKLIHTIAGKPTVAAYLRVAALIGIARHVKVAQAAGAELDAGTQGIVAGAMLKIIGEKPKLGQEAGHLWLQKQAVEIVGDLGFLGDDRSVVEQLAAVIADPKRPLELKYAVCEALGNFKIPEPPKSGTKQLVDQIAMLAADACREEMYMASTPGQTVSRGRVVARVGSVMTGIYGAGGEGVGVGATDVALNGYVQQLHEKLAKVKDGFSANGLSETNLKKALEASADMIEAFVSAAPASDPAATDADLLDDPGGKPAADATPAKVIEPKKTPKAAPSPF